MRQTSNKQTLRSLDECYFTGHDGELVPWYDDDDTELTEDGGDDNTDEYDLNPRIYRVFFFNYLDHQNAVVYMMLMMTLMTMMVTSNNYDVGAFMMLVTTMMLI